MALTFQEMQAEIQQTVGDTGPDMLDHIRKAINLAYREMAAVSPQYWVLEQKTLTVAAVDSYAAGTVTFTNGSADVAGDGTTFTEGMVGRKMILATSTVPYTIKTVTDGTNIVLDRVYEGETAAGASYLVYQDKYSLPSDFGEMLILRDLSNNSVLPSFDTTQVEEFAATASATGLPTRYALFGEDSSGYEQLLFSPAPGDVISYGYRYYKEPAIMDGEIDTLDTPPKYDHVVIALLKAQFTQNPLDQAIAVELLDNMISANVRHKRVSVQKEPFGGVGIAMGRRDPNAVLSRS